MGTVAAIFVATNGVYFDLDGVDPWDEARDARLYPGPYPIIGHSPCERWGRYARGGPNPLARRRELGDDGGCFASVLASVRKWGGVIEHPEASHAWRHFGLVAPPKRGGWVPAGDWIGWTCCVEQGHYGHKARKATWLYAVGCDLPELQWGPRTRRTRSRGSMRAFTLARSAVARRSAEPFSGSRRRRRRPLRPRSATC